MHFGVDVHYIVISDASQINYCSTASAMLAGVIRRVKTGYSRSSYTDDSPPGPSSQGLARQPIARVSFLISRHWVSVGSRDTGLTGLLRRIPPWCWPIKTLWLVWMILDSSVTWVAWKLLLPLWCTHGVCRCFMVASLAPHERRSARMKG